MKVFLILFFLFPMGAHADFDLSQFNFGLGVVNVGLAETESGLKATEGSAEQSTGPGSSAVSATSGFIEYEKFLNSKLSVLAKTAFPIMPSPTGSYVFVGSGLNYYFNSISTTGTFTSKESRITFMPKWRFHAGGGLGGAYVVYLTEDAKKSDTLIEVFGNGGVTYTKDKKMAYRLEGTYARAIGFSSTASVIKILLGMVYTFR